MNQNNSPQKPRKSSNRRRKSNRSPGGQSKLPRDEYLRNRHQNLLDTYLAARKKLYDVSYKADPRQKAKLEKSLFTATKQLRDFEDQVHSSPEDRELYYSVIEQKRLQEDHTYSTIHQLDRKQEVEKDLDISDPHFLITQSESNFIEDKEESQGNMEDYSSYKGL